MHDPTDVNHPDTRNVTHDEFIRLVDALRERGAAHVKAGDLEVSFYAPQAAFDPAELFPEEEDHEAAAKERTKQWNLEQYGSSG